MSYILTTVYPISDGDAAAAYAAGLASVLGLPLRIVYPYTIPVAVGEMPLPLLPVEEVREAAQSRLDEVTGKFTQQYARLSVSSDVIYGDLEDVLDQVSEAEKPLLTIVGSSFDDTDDWFGSDTSNILRRGKLPVLAVGAKKAFTKPAQICLACDSQSIREGLPLESLLALQRLLSFKVTVLHVASQDGDGYSGYEGSKLEGQLGSVSSGFVEISALGQVDEAIASFSDTHGMDWLAMAPHHYGFWEGLFHKSHTSRVLHLAHVPVLALHGAD